MTTPCYPSMACVAGSQVRADATPWSQDHAFNVNLNNGNVNNNHRNNSGFGLAARRAREFQGANMLSIFQHADYLHLISNLSALAIVGPRVWRAMGWWRFVVMFLLAGTLANTGAAAFLDRPVIGASSAVAGVAAAHLVHFPLSRLALLIGLWIVVQAIFAGIALELGGVAWSAHLIGAAIGAAVALAFRSARKGATDA